jgi:hypothetical protein
MAHCAAGSHPAAPAMPITGVVRELLFDLASIDW